MEGQGNKPDESSLGFFFHVGKGMILMAREFARAFYNSKEWKKCREGYIKSVGGLCERCLAKGKYVLGEEVHHKIPLTPENIDDPNVTLNWDNLELLCSSCHSIEHNRKEKEVLMFDENGDLVEYK